MKRAICMFSALIFAAFSCSAPDPIHDDAVAKLGPEKGSANEFHRAGQPCGTCHSAKTGPAKTDFSVAGTVFATPASLVGVENATIAMVDSAGTSPDPVTTNCVGNFFIARSAWDPVLPITSVTIALGATTVKMKSPIGGTASCATCHLATTAPPNPQTKLGAVWLFDPASAPPPPSSSCPVSPDLGVK